MRSALNGTFIKPFEVFGAYVASDDFQTKMLLDATANILILGPILMPVAIAFGIDPIHFSLIMIINLIIGLGTPPVGTVLFATVPIAKVSVEKISVAILPFCLAQLVILGFVTYVPALTMWIPTMLGYVY